MKKRIILQKKMFGKGDGTYRFLRGAGYYSNGHWMIVERKVDDFAIDPDLFSELTQEAIDDVMNLKHDLIPFRVVHLTNERVTINKRQVCIFKDRYGAEVDILLRYVKYFGLKKLWTDPNKIGESVLWYGDALFIMPVKL